MAALLMVALAFSSLNDSTHSLLPLARVPHTQGQPLPIVVRAHTDYTLTLVSMPLALRLYNDSEVSRRLCTRACALVVDASRLLSTL